VGELRDEPVVEDRAEVRAAEGAADGAEVSSAGESGDVADVAEQAGGAGGVHRFLRVAARRSRRSFPRFLPAAKPSAWWVAVGVGRPGDGPDGRQPAQNGLRVRAS
jgi:hypothetical protein